MTPKTLSKERRERFEEIIAKWLADSPAITDVTGDKSLLRKEIMFLAFDLAKASESRSEVRGIEAAMFADRPVSDEDMEEKTIRAATNEFESALGCGQFPWDSTAVWTKFRKWVVEIYKFTPTLFREYNQWRDGEGKFGDAMRNPKIRENPEAFMTTGWATFMFKTAAKKTDEERGEYRPGRISA